MRSAASARLFATHPKCGSVRVDEWNAMKATCAPVSVPVPVPVPVSAPGPAMEALKLRDEARCRSGEVGKWGSGTGNEFFVLKL
jgi:hypothetical protein